VLEVSCLHWKSTCCHRNRHGYKKTSFSDRFRLIGDVSLSSSCLALLRFLFSFCLLKYLAFLIEILIKLKYLAFLRLPPANLYKCNSCLFQIGCIIFPGDFPFQIGCIIFPGVFLFPFWQNFPESDESVLAYSSSSLYSYSPSST